jgi:hypothetical protein
MPIGCSTHSMSITDRAGGIIVGNGSSDLISVEYTRVLNDASTARVTIGVTGPGCCDQLSNIRSWRHRLNIYRGDEFMWSGLITSIDWTFDRVVIDATDIIGLLDRRVPHKNFSFTGTDITEIARQLVEDGLAPDDPGHTVTVIGSAGVAGGRAYSKDIGQTADHLRDLSDTGLDFVAVGNNIVILPDDFCDVVGRLSDEDMPDGLTVTEDGAALATRWVVAGSEASGAVGTAGGTDSYYGLLEQYAEQTTITTQAAADAAAAARLRSSKSTPTVINTKNITLAPTANVDLLQLVPGWCLDITTRITCRDITQRLKISGLQISEDGGSGNSPGQERIKVQVVASSGVQNVGVA